MYTAYIDLDGTLLNDQKCISEFTYETLTNFMERGNNIVLATARSQRLQGLQDCLKNITPHFILHNGGEILSGGKIINRTYFNAEQTKAIGAYLTDNGIKAAVITQKTYYANYNAPAVWGDIANFVALILQTKSFAHPNLP